MGSVVKVILNFVFWIAGSFLISMYYVYKSNKAVFL